MVQGQARSQIIEMLYHHLPVISHSNQADKTRTGIKFCLTTDLMHACKSVSHLNFAPVGIYVSLKMSKMGFFFKNKGSCDDVVSS